MTSGDLVGRLWRGDPAVRCRVSSPLEDGILWRGDLIGGDVVIWNGRRWCNFSPPRATRSNHVSIASVCPLFLL